VARVKTKILALDNEAKLGILKSLTIAGCGLASRILPDFQLDTTDATTREKLKEIFFMDITAGYKIY
jgi:hypothetical protein